MKEVNLEVKKRESRGKEKAKKLRKSEIIPAVVYGAGEEALPLEVKLKDLKAFFKATKGENVIINLNIDDGKLESRKVLLREVQKDPVWDNILHVDFQHISLTEKITVKIPIHLIGLSTGVKNQGGILEHVLRELEIKCLPTEVPQHIDVDVTELEIGDVIHVKDLKVEKLEILTDPDRSIVTVVPPTVFKEPEVAAVVEEGKEPELVGAEKEGEEAAEGEEGKEEKEGEAKAETKEEKKEGRREEKKEKKEKKEEKKEEKK
ncbi:MAG TPA: 50S ribosomal protein L25/general stress protein Ctc [candidate division Zixibacteria bacterium]